MNVVKKTTRIVPRTVVSPEIVERHIFLIRGYKVMLDSHLAELYGVSVGRLNESVRRNIDRFPSDFMFQLSAKEFENMRMSSDNLNLISQFAISSLGWGGRRHPPYAFTEQGVAMLSGILKSKKAAQVNIAIMRAFVKLREILSTHKELAHKLDQLEQKIQKHDQDIQGIFEAIRGLMSSPALPEKPKIRIGFHARK